MSQSDNLTSEINCLHTEFVLHFHRSKFHYNNIIIAFVAINVVVSVVVSCSNFVVIYTISRTPSLRTPSNILILGLAIADFFVGVLSQPTFCIIGMRSSFKTYIKALCTIAIVYDLSTWCFGAMSFFTLTAITVDRFLAVHFHLRYQELVTTKRYGITLALIFVLGLFTAICKFVFHNMVFFAMILSLLVILLPLNAYLIFKISQVIHRHSVQIQAQQQSVQQSIDMPRYKKSVNTMYYVIGAFVVCYVPYFCGLIVLCVVQKLTPELNNLFIFTVFLVMFNGVLNPIIYCWRIGDIRSNAIRLLRRIWKRSENQVE
jgi:hypothetical protein